MNIKRRKVWIKRSIRNKPSISAKSWISKIRSVRNVRLKELT